MSVKVTLSLNSFLTTACTKSFIFSVLYMLEGKTEGSQVAHRVLAHHSCGRGDRGAGQQAETEMTQEIEM